MYPKHRFQRGVLLYHEGAVHVTADPCTYVVESQTDPENQHYLVWLDAHGEKAECSCIDWQKHGPGHFCKHLHAADIHRLCNQSQDTSVGQPSVPVEPSIAKMVDDLYGHEPGNGRVPPSTPIQPAVTSTMPEDDPLIPCPWCEDWPCTCRPPSESEKRFWLEQIRQRDWEDAPHAHGWQETDRGWEPIRYPKCPLCQRDRDIELDESPAHR